ncbi:hypothetical protein SNOG_05367 [Parastagonospora nodorum SN15]|uniref:Uncharacterized protein n=1 Tax=Phaeosphaeria nodorum (strain SN15 / ATCC MYA-4574 / FGSC 10173) TaxID=321614 RepID=Q0US97_PHANO|nr:hypothetical protein SNOG_05367 [Parastagonospora nodorum SN15]EAT87758.1 hypothetical protein SNOG_05367 [Parastagonospora nodorum SN15]
MDKDESFHFEKLVLGRRTTLLKVAVRDLLDQWDIGKGAPTTKPTAAEVVENLKEISTWNM